MNRERLSAPTADQTILAHPSLSTIGQLLVQNRQLLDGWRYNFQGRTAAQVRRMARSAIISAAESEPPLIESPEAARVYPTRPGPSASSTDSDVRLDPPPLLVTGHQPELFHPGVWAKNFASHDLALRHHGVSLHLVVDNDTVKRTTIRLPAGTESAPSIVHIPFDRWRGEIPFEEYAIADLPLFASFGERVAAALESFNIKPLAATFWPWAVEASRKTQQLSRCIAAARREQERVWNCNNLELPVSGLCQIEAFYWFACHIIAQLDRFRSAYNDVVADYRRRNHIRSRNHPVPSLGEEGGWLESPFWVWTEGSPRRRQLFVRPQGHEIQLTDRDQWTHSLPLSVDREACCAVEAMAELSKHGVKIRTRALTTTLFSRLCLGDLFIHGLGGARYDELTDGIIQRFFGISPPEFLILTGTLRLPFTPRPGSSKRLHELQRRERDLLYSPNRFLPNEAIQSDAVQKLVQSKQEWIRSSPESAADRLRRFHEIRLLNESLGAYVSTARSDTSKQIEEVRLDLDANAILLNREWAFCAYPAELLRRFFQIGS